MESRCSLSVKMLKKSMYVKIPYWFLENNPVCTSQSANFAPTFHSHCSLLFRMDLKLKVTSLIVCTDAESCFVLVDQINDLTRKI